MSRQYFESMGQQARSLGRPSTYRRMEFQSLPSWCREAFAAGWIMQGHTNYRRLVQGKSGSEK